MSESAEAGGGRDLAPTTRRSNLLLYWLVGGGLALGIGGVASWLLLFPSREPAVVVGPAAKANRYAIPAMEPDPAARPRAAPVVPQVSNIAPASLEAGSGPVEITIRGTGLEGVSGVRAEGSEILFSEPSVSADGRRVTVRAEAPRAAAIGEFRFVLRTPSGDAAPALTAGDKISVSAPAPPVPVVAMPPPPVRVGVAPGGPEGVPKIDPVLARRLGSPIGNAAGGEAGGAAARAGESEKGGGGVDLSATKIELVKARRLSDMTMIIPAGTQIACVLDTAIQTDQAGFVSCSMAANVFGADGTVVLLDRGSQIIGEYRPTTISYGKSRVFVVWARVRTPTGVLVEINSPGTGPLGRAGFGGNIDNHYWERVGVPVLMSAISFGIQTGLETAIQSAVNGNNGNNNGNNNFQQVGQAADNSLQGVFAEFAKIKPTLSKNQGDLVNVMVMRDLDLGPVYKLISQGSLR